MVNFTMATAEWRFTDHFAAIATEILMSGACFQSFSDTVRFAERRKEKLLQICS